MNFEPAKTQIKVAAADVLMVLGFRAYNDIRYYLNGIHIAPSQGGGANIIATDGTALVCVHDECGRCEDSITLPIGKDQSKYLRRGEWVYSDATGRAWITDEQHRPLWVSPDLAIEGTFPDVRKVIAPLDEYVPGLVGTFNPNFIDRVRKAVGGSRDPRAKGVHFFHRPDAEHSAQLCTLGIKGFAVLMPMRGAEPAVALETAVPVDFRLQKAA